MIEIQTILFLGVKIKKILNILNDIDLEKPKIIKENK